MLNLGRSVIVLTGIVCLSEVSSFTATDYLQFPMLTASVGTVSFTAVPMLLYAIFEQPMRDLSTASSEASLTLGSVLSSTTTRAANDAHSANAAWRNLVGYPLLSPLQLLLPLVLVLVLVLVLPFFVACSCLC